MNLVSSFLFSLARQLAVYRLIVYRGLVQKVPFRLFLKYSKEVLIESNTSCIKYEHDQWITKNQANYKVRFREPNSSLCSTATHNL